MPREPIFWTESIPTLSPDEVVELYIKPAVEHNPLGAAYLLFGENALKALFGNSAPLLKVKNQ